MKAHHRDIKKEREESTVLSDVETAVSTQSQRDIEDEILEKRYSWAKVHNGEWPKFLILSRDNRERLLTKLSFPQLSMQNLEKYAGMEICLRQHWDDEPFVEVAG